MNILLPKRWQKQPQTPVEIDWSHPLAKGLTGLWIFNTKNPVNLVTGEKSVGTVSNFGVNKNGRGANNTSTTSLQLASNFENLTNGANGSIFMLANGVETINQIKNFVSANTGSSYTGIFGDTSERFYFYWKSSTAYSPGNAELDYQIQEKEILFSSSATSRKAYAGGRLIATTTGGGTTATNTPFVLGASNGYNANVQSLVNAVAVWNRQLSDKEAFEASRNIYQVLRPQRRLFPTTESQTFDFDLNLPTLDFTADLVAVEEGQEFFELDLPLPALSFSGEAIKGEAIEFDLGIKAPDLFMEMGIVNRFSLSLPLPTLDLALTAFVGSTIDNIDLILPKLDIGGDLVAGTLMALDLELPSIDIALTFGDELSLELPALDFSATIITGNTMAISFPLPAIELSAEVSTSNAMALALDLSVDIALTAVTGNVIEIDLPFAMPVLQGELLGGSVFDLALDFELDTDLSIATSAFMEIDLDLPSLVFDAVLYGAQTRAGRFYNRWTR